MNMEDLFIFRTVAKHGSITKAAEKFNFVQSSVTAKIKRLEAYFQTQLFYRHRYGVALTPSGKILLDYVEKITYLFQQAENDLLYSKKLKGPLAIGSMETTAAVRLPKPLATFARNYPDVELSLKTGPTDELIRLVHNHELDGAFVAGPICHRGLVYEEIFREELVLVGKSEWFHDENYGELADRPLLVFKQGCSYRKKLEEWLQSQKIVPTKRLEFGSLEAIIGCVNAGLGVSLLPKSVITRFQSSDSFEWRPIYDGWVTTYWIRRQDVMPSMAMTKFLEIVKTSDGDASFVV